VVRRHNPEHELHASANPELEAEPLQVSLDRAGGHSQVRRNRDVLFVVEDAGQYLNFSPRQLEGTAHALPSSAGQDAGAEEAFGRARDRAW
jgi:hypothetical protein